MTLRHHSFAEWAEIIRRRLLDLGCSPAYADAERDRILSLGRRREEPLS